MSCPESRVRGIPRITSKLTGRGARFEGCIHHGELRLPRGREDTCIQDFNFLMCLYQAYVIRYKRKHTFSNVAVCGITRVP